MLELQRCRFEAPPFDPPLRARRAQRNGHRCHRASLRPRRARASREGVELPVLAAARPSEGSCSTRHRGRACRSSKGSWPSRSPIRWARSSPPRRKEEAAMADILFVLVSLAFFGLCTLYVRGCERIIGGSETRALRKTRRHASASRCRRDRRQHRRPGPRSASRRLSRRRAAASRRGSRCRQRVGRSSSCSWRWSSGGRPRSVGTWPRCTATTRTTGEKKAPGDRVFLPIERGIYRLCRIDAEAGTALDHLCILGDRVQHLQPSVAVRVVATPGVVAGEPERPAGTDARTCRGTRR